MKLIVETLGLARSSYYARKIRQPSKRQLENELLTTELRSIWAEHRFVYGAPKLHYFLQKQGYRLSIKRVQKLMRKAGIKSITMKKWRPSGKQSPAIEQENLIKQDFSTTGLNQKWTADITYIKTVHDGWTYLSSIIDIHSRKVIAWELGKRMTEELVVNTLKKALMKSPQAIKENLIIQTDLGSQYTSIAFNQLVDQYKMKHSYSRKGTPYDNIMIEAFHSVLKKEKVYQNVYASFDEAKRALFRYIEGFYNSRRIHSSLDYLTPNQAEQKALEA